jgi:hypothetical protein
MGLDQIDRQYNPEFDTPTGNQPRVSWADKALLEAVRELAGALLETQAKVAALEAEIEAFHPERAA